MTNKINNLDSLLAACGGDFNLIVKVPLTLLNEAIELGNRRTRIQSKWQGRTAEKEKAMQSWVSGTNLTADQLGCVGELLARSMVCEANLVHFSSLINEDEDGITKEEQRPDIVIDDFSVDIKTVEEYRNNIAVPARHIDKGLYNGLLCVRFDVLTLTAQVFYLDLKTCKKTFKKGQVVNGYAKSNYYLLPCLEKPNN